MNEKSARIELAQDDAARRCQGCRIPPEKTIDLAFAFQPIVDTRSRIAYAHEALVCGPNGESAASVLSQVDEANRYHFDQRCRTVAIEQAAALNLEGYLSINFMPNAVYQPEACIRSTLEAAEQFQFASDRIIFETVEGENIISRPHLVDIFRAYRRFDFQTAIDDFGAGYSGLTLLTEFQPDLIKLDMELVRGIDTDSVRQRIVRGVLSMCRELGIRVIAEGIETRRAKSAISSSPTMSPHAGLFLRQAGVSLGARGDEGLAGCVAGRLSSGTTIARIKDCTRAISVRSPYLNSFGEVSWHRRRCRIFSFIRYRTCTARRSS